jgi:hypothetical protein
MLIRDARLRHRPIMAGSHDVTARMSIKMSATVEIWTASCRGTGKGRVRVVRKR